jgi:hypothetical protein
MRKFTSITSSLPQFGVTINLCRERAETVSRYHTLSFFAPTGVLKSVIQTNLQNYANIGDFQSISKRSKEVCGCLRSKNEIGLSQAARSRLTSQTRVPVMPFIMGILWQTGAAGLRRSVFDLIPNFPPPADTSMQLRCLRLAAVFHTHCQRIPLVLGPALGRNIFAVWPVAC